MTPRVEKVSIPYWLVAGLATYLISLYLVENTILRINSDGVKTLCLGSIVESFVSPIRTVFLSLKYADIETICYVIFGMCHFSNPYFTLLLFYLFF